MAHINVIEKLMNKIIFPSKWDTDFDLAAKNKDVENR